MTFSRTALLLLASAGSLAACSQPAGNTTTTAAGSSAAPAAAPSSGPDTAITAADLPHPRAGLWAVSTSTNGEPAHTAQSCYHGEPFKMNEHPVPGCTGMQLKRTFLGDYVMDASCSEHGIQTVMHMDVHGDFTGGSYTTNGSVHMVLPGRPPMDITSHSEAHWIGPC
jgi:hypothetical protein